MSERGGESQVRGRVETCRASESRLCIMGTVLRTCDDGQQRVHAYVTRLHGEGKSRFVFILWLAEIEKERGREICSTALVIVHSTTRRAVFVACAVVRQFDKW